jgi:hypothetical protein
MPASVAADWTIFGEAATFMRYTTLDEDAGDSSTYSQAPWDVGDLGALYKSDEFEGKFVIQLNDNGGTGDTTAQFDKAWIRKKFDAMSIQIGYADSLTFNPVEPWAMKYAASGIGGQIGGTRKYVLNFTFPVAKGMSFAVQASQPNTAYATGINGWVEAMAAPLIDPVTFPGDGISTNTELTMPAIEVKFSAFTGFPWAVFAGYQTYDVTAEGQVAGVAVDEEETISAYLFGAVARPSIGPLRTSIVASYATNGFQTGGAPNMTTPAFGSYPIGGWNYDPTQDTTKLGVAFGAEMMFTEQVGIGFGAGWQRFEADGDYEDPTIAYYVSMKYAFAKNFAVYPYICIENYDTVTLAGNDIDQGTMTQFGLVWKANL